MRQRYTDGGGQIAGMAKTPRAGRRAPRRLALCAAIALSLAASARPGEAATMSEIGDRAGDVGAAAFDLAVLRPLHGAAVVLGTVFFAASAPIVAAGNAATGDFDFPAVRTAWDVFVYAPYEYTVLRDIGDF